MSKRQRRKRQPRRTKHNKYAEHSKAPKRDHRRSATCAKKVRHISQKAAAESAEDLNARGRNLEPYYCPICSGYHLGTSRP